jgi:cobalt-zinc-cadmium efflux system outer membrane protein
MVRVALIATSLYVASASASAGAEVARAFAGLSLSTALDLSVAASPDVAAADAVVIENTAALAAARSSVGPSAFTNYSLAPQGGTGGTISQRLTSYGLQTTLGDTLSGPRVAAAEAGLREARALRDAAILSERVKAAGLFYDALEARSISSARGSALDLAREEARAAEIRFHAGDAPRLDVVRADVAVAQATADDATARAADENATEALQAETGVAAQALSTVGDARDAEPASDIPSPAAAVARALASRPELLAAQSATSGSEAEARAKSLAQLPAVTIAAGYASGVDSGVVVAGPQLTLDVSFPLSGAAGAETRRQAAVVSENRAKRAALERKIRLDVAAAARNLAAAHESAAAAMRAREAAAGELAATQLGYARGYTAGLEFANAREVYVRALVDALTASYDEAKARAVLGIEMGP